MKLQKMTDAKVISSYRICSEEYRNCEAAADYAGMRKWGQRQEAAAKELKLRMLAIPDAL